MTLVKSLTKVNSSVYNPPAAMQGGVHVFWMYCLQCDPTQGDTMELIGEENIAALGWVVNQNGPAIIFRWREVAKV